MLAVDVSGSATSKWATSRSSVASGLVSSSVAVIAVAFVAGFLGAVAVGCQQPKLVDLDLVGGQLETLVDVGFFGCEFDLDAAPGLAVVEGASGG